MKNYHFINFTQRLKEENISLLKEIFELGPLQVKENEGVQIIMSRFFLNVEIMRKYLENLEVKNENIQKAFIEKDHIIIDLTNQNNILREVKT